MKRNSDTFSCCFEWNSFFLVFNYYTTELITSFRFNYYKNNYLIIHLIVCNFIFMFQAAGEKLSTKKERGGGLWVSKSIFYISLGGLRVHSRIQKDNSMRSFIYLSHSILIYCALQQCSLNFVFDLQFGIRKEAERYRFLRIFGFECNLKFQTARETHFFVVFAINLKLNKKILKVFL